MTVRRYLDACVAQKAFTMQSVSTSAAPTVPMGGITEPAMILFGRSTLRLVDADKRV